MASLITEIPGVFIHEKAMCESYEVGEGTRIWGGSHVLEGAKIGKDCNICEGVFIENNVSVGNSCTVKNGVSIWDFVTLEDGVFVGPNVVFTNDMRPRAFLKRGNAHHLPTLVKKGATLGANCTIICGATLNSFCMVGAGSVVTQDVEAHALVVGNPAKVVGRVCYCGQKLSEEFCSMCKKSLAENSYEHVMQFYHSLEPAVSKAIL